MTALFITVLNMSITASVVALAVMLVRLPLKKAPKIFSYALWGVVLFRLICPFSFDSFFSLVPTSSNAIPQGIVYSQNPTIETGVQFVDIPINAAINNIFPSVSSENILSENTNNTDTVNITNSIYTVLQITGRIWLLGFFILLLYAIIGFAQLKRRIRYSTLVSNNVYETDKIKTPFVLGFIRPKIYIPIGIDPVQQSYILTHEQTHIKRRDYLIKPFAFIAFALHWFNPLMWAAYFLMSKDIEMSCDETVLRKSNEDIRGVYSTSLLNLSVKRVSLLTPLAFGESDVKLRVKNALNFKKPSRVIIVVALTLVALFSVGFAGNSASEPINSSLPFAIYENPENPNYHHQIVFQDKHFIQVGTALEPEKRLKNKTIGYAENLKSNSTLYVYSISGYDENNFIFVEELQDNMLNTGYYKELCFYVSDTVTDIPFQFVYMNMSRGAELSYEQREYNYYSQAPVEFQIGEKLGETNDNIGATVSIYSIPGHENDGWIAVKENDNNDIIRLFWTDSIKYLPMEYLNFPQEYYTDDYMQRHMN